MKTTHTASPKTVAKQPAPTTSVSSTAPHIETHTAKQSKRRLSKIQKSTLALRKNLWPKVADEDLWLVRDKDGKTDKKGFVEIPRTLPLLIEIIDAASKQVAAGGKSVRAGRAYLVLWVARLMRG